MKKFYLTAISFAMSMSIFGQSKINPEGISLLDQFKTKIEMVNNPDMHSLLSRASQSSLAIPTVSAVISLDNDNAIGDIEAAGAEIIRVRGNLIIVRMPLQIAGKIADIDAVRSMSFGTKSSPRLDKARDAMGVTSLQNADDLETVYKGAGVIVGLMDQGIDPNHKAFTDESGNNRVSRVWTIMGSNTKVTSYETPEAIAAFQTDDTSTSHGTHVAGIIGGSYNGVGRCRVEQTNATGTTSVAVKSKIQFWGMAPEADIAMACGDFYDANILEGVENIIDYAKAENKPAVINLSLGGNIGAHDGTGLTEQYLSALGEEAIICLAAGNEGGDPMSITRTLTAESPEIKTFLMPKSNEKDQAIGLFEAWTTDPNPLTVTFVLYDTSASSIVYSQEVTGTSGAVTVSKSGDDTLNKAWITGSKVRMVPSIDANNNRYHFYSEVTIGQNDARYIPAFILKGNPGQTVECFVSDLGLYSNAVPGWTQGSGENSASTMCSADNIISVGAWTTKNRYYPANGAGGYSTTNIVNEICSFSSYGRQLITGKEIPDICAPGAAIISAYSRYYVNEAVATGEISSVNNLCGISPASNPTDYWHAMQGTSMATPAVTGSIALMLQADPTLGVNEVRDILRATADAPDSAYDNLRWGAGKINALKAVKEVLNRRSGIGAIVADDESSLIIRDLGSRQFNIFVAAAQSIDATLYSTSGAAVASLSASTNDATLDASAVTPGVYILAVDAANSRMTRKIIIR